nr:MAG TPA: hypothetical protein [Crassvirales sp.]
MFLRYTHRLLLNMVMEQLTLQIYLRILNMFQE